MSNQDAEHNLCVVPSIRGIPKQVFLTTAGNGTGDYNLIGNYSATPTDFYYQSPTTYYIETLLVVISDNASFNQLDYGAIAGGLTNGIKFFVKPNGAAEIPLLSGIAFKKNHEWLAVTPHSILTNFAGLSQTLTVNFDIVVDYGMPITLNTGDRFIARLNDDFSSLVSHTFGLRGRLI